MTGIAVAEIEDGAALGALLNAEREWAVYGLCDLEPPHRSRSRYIGAYRNGQFIAAVLIFSPGPYTSVIPYGDSEGVRAILSTADDLPARALFQARECDLPALELRYTVRAPLEMDRMAVRADGLHSRTVPGVTLRRLGDRDGLAVTRLYEHWPAVVFSREALGTATFVGALDGDSLVAVAGTHARSLPARIAAIGSVFTHPGYRSRGLAGAVTAEVVEKLANAGIAEAQLNVRRDNPAAIRAYARIGFRRTMSFVEGDLEAS